jgi:AcrR family transcriptional regulator
MAAVKPKTTKPVKGVKENGVSWQSQKSAMTRDRILEAAIDCFIKLGYTNVTTAKVADFAGVSRGAMLHHFPSKTELIQAAVEFLHGKLLNDFTQKVALISQELIGKDRRRAGLDAYWDHLTGDLFIVFHELCVAGRTDDDLNVILESSATRFEDHVRESNKVMFKEWNDRGDLYHLAMDITKFLMEGMAVGQWGQDRDKRVNRLLDYLADRLEEIFTDTGPTAISQHTS